MFVSMIGEMRSTSLIGYKSCGNVVSCQCHVTKVIKWAVAGEKRGEILSNSGRNITEEDGRSGEGSDGDDIKPTAKACTVKK